MFENLPVVVPDPANRHTPFPLTDTQHAYLLGRGETFELGNNSVHGYYEYEGELDIPRFNRAWQRVIARHDMLRAVVLADKGMQQVLADVPAFEAEVVDLRNQDPESGLLAVRNRLSHELKDPGTWPLFTVVVSRLTDEKVRVHVGFDGLNLDYLSWRLLLADLTRFYEDPELDIADPVLTFRDYVLTEARVNNAEAQQYWHDRLDTLPPAPELPLAVDPATIEKPTFVRHDAWMPAEQWSALKTLAAQHKLTSTGLVLAAFAEVLAEWSKSAHFTINLPRLQRLPLHDEVDGVLGAFTSLTLLEVDNRGTDTFIERARRLQRQLWSDLAHSEVSGMAVLRDLVRAQGSFGKAAMPIVLTSTLNFSAGGNPLLGEQLPPVYFISQTPQVFMDVQIEEEGGELYYSWDTVDELFPVGLIDAMFGAFTSVLEQLSHVDAWELQSFGLTHAQPLAGPVVELQHERAQDLFLEQAAAQPDAIAIISADRTLTYGELLVEATQVGHWLRSQGATPNQPVAILMDKGWQQVVAVLGTLLAGAPYLPLDLNFPEHRITDLLERCNVRQVLTSLDQLPVGLSTQPLEPLAGANDLAYVIFTSGSTGQPKGVMIEHHSVVNCVETTLREHGPIDRCLAVTALHHDLSVFDLFGTLGSGGTLVIPSAIDPAQWASLIREHQVTFWNSVPAMMEMLLAHTTQGLESLDLVILGGDWIPLHIPRTLDGIANRVVSIGGPTETTVWNIWYPIGTVDPAWKSVPYGSPIANAKYYVLDDELAFRPTWAVGEMWCAGEQVARGYWGVPESDSFRTHPVTGERIYRTGDLGRVRPDGIIEFIGRADFQIKLHGMRIEPGAIESALQSHPDVRRALVVPVKKESGNGYRGLIGYVTGSASADDLKAHLRTLVSEHMVPGTMIVLDEFPLTANGKIDRKALPTVELVEQAYEPPKTALQELIAGIWAEILDVEQVGVHDDYFSLGGDSPRATQIVSLLREILDAPLTIKVLFTNPTVAGLASALDDERFERIARLHLDVAALSDDEIEAQLLALEGGA